MTLHELARAAGIAIDWWDAKGLPQRVTDSSLEMILGSLGLPAGSEAEIAKSMARLEEERHMLPTLLTVDAGTHLALPAALASASSVILVAEDGSERSLSVEGGTVPPVSKPGYYQLLAAGQELTLAVAPVRCFAINEGSDRRMWGPAVQIPALRDESPRGFGNFGHLARAVETFAASGADAMAISPVHALYPADGGRFSPYSPSSRQFLNIALADPALLDLPSLPPEPEPELIDWAAAIPAHYDALLEVFRRLEPTTRGAIEVWAQECGEGLRRHALFEALYLHFAAGGAHSWQDWPSEFHDADGEPAKRFADENPAAIAFQVFAQWLAAKGLQRVQSRARSAGMALGLIADLAVGVDPGGSDSWSMPDLLLNGLTIGAPPDPLGPDGQNWGLTAFSPNGLRKSGFAQWLAMLRASLGACGGLRIDHAFGLRRLWVIPRGASAMEGAYLSYPFDDLLRLLALESHRARALVVAEDLGTMPAGFRDDITRKGLLGMRVLWFERDEAGRFRGADEYDRDCVAMTGTHDLPTIAGWWHGRDIDWAWKLGRASEFETERDDRASRERDRERLWTVIGGGRPRPSVDDTSAAVDAAVGHVASSNSRLAIFPLEDVLGLEEQPNLPGTIDEHPNWRRRLPQPLEDMLADRKVATRIAAIDAERSR